MTRAEAARILAISAAYDRRTVGETDAIAWADALTGLNPRECADAVRTWYREHDTWLMPAHIRQLVEQHHRAQLEAKRNAETLREIAAPVDKQAAQKAFTEHVQPVIDELAHRGSSERTARTIRCPFCEAPIGDACTVNGRTRGKSHPSRYEAVDLEPPAYDAQHRSDAAS